MDPLPIINRTYDLYKIIVALNDHAEKRWRYSLGQSLETTVLNCLTELILAKNAPKPLKTAFLINADANFEVAVFKLRLFLELKIANETKIFQAQAKIREIGTQLGGWIKSLQDVKNEDTPPRDETRHADSDCQDCRCSSSPADCLDSSLHSPTNPNENER
jgi:hypothetical protein